MTVIGMKKSNKPPEEPLSKNERIRRHNENIKKNKRRWNKAFLAVLLTAALVCVAVLVVFVFFRTDGIRIEGTTRYTDRQIADASAIEAGSPLLLLSGKEVEERIITSLPYIGAVEVKKEFSGLVVLTVTETNPAFYTTAPGGFVLFDASGKVVEYPATVLPEGCVEVKGLTNISTKPGYALQSMENEKFYLFLELSSLCNQASIGTVNGMDLSDLYDIRVVIDDAFILSFGNSENLENKLAIASQIMLREGESAVGNMKLIDLSYGNEAFVRDVTHTTAVAVTDGTGEPTSDPSGETNDASDENGEDKQDEESYETVADTTVLTAEG